VPYLQKTKSGTMQFFNILAVSNCLIITKQGNYAG